VTPRQPTNHKLESRTKEKILAPGDRASGSDGRSGAWSREHNCSAPLTFAAGTSLETATNLINLVTKCLN
jgi:hypothetical protein